MHHKCMFERKTLIISIFIVCVCVGGGGYLMSAPYDSNFLFFAINPIVPRTSNLWDSTVIVHDNRKRLTVMFSFAVYLWFIRSFSDTSDISS